jgi:hypothetical protein
MSGIRVVVCDFKASLTSKNQHLFPRYLVIWCIKQHSESPPFGKWFVDCFQVL